MDVAQPLLIQLQQNFHASNSGNTTEEGEERLPEPEDQDARGEILCSSYDNKSRLTESQQHGCPEKT